MTSMTLLSNNAKYKVVKQRVDFAHKGIPVAVQKSAAALALLLLSPIIIIAALCIKLESRGPVFFSQVRIGEFGRHFRCYKLRSMYLKSDPKFKEPDPTQSDRDGICKKYINDPRITKVGRFIRKYSIDELPQLWNVVTGDMAMIGPRPPLDIEYCAYNRDIMPRMFCKPGITGLWQVNGRADTNFDEQIWLDKHYVNAQSIILDIGILLSTIPAVLKAKGAY